MAGPRLNSTSETVSFRIVLELPPAGIDFALQKGKGGSYEPVQKQRSTGRDLIFEFSATSKQTAKGLDFAGPFVQGAAGDRFVYIDIGRYAGQTGTECARRLKIPLTGISRASIQTGKTLVTTIPGAAPDGQPNCAYTWRKYAGAGWGWAPGR